MAANNFTLRFKTENGPCTLNDLTCDTTVQVLKSKLEEITNIKAVAMKFLNGYPPKPLVIEDDNLKLGELGVRSGDTIIIETIKIGSSADQARQNNIFYDVMQQSGIMMRHVVPSNNSCLFTSIHFILSNGEMDDTKSNDLRKIIATVVESNAEKYNEAFLGKSNLEYCAWILDTNHWGGAIELSILSEHFQVEIVAIDTMCVKAHCFGESKNYSNRIFLIYDGIHYDPLIMELGSDQQTVFPVSDPKPMELAMEIAREAKSSHQFTDTANFKLCCKICDKILKGEKEASEHAVSTGHCEFGEKL